MSQGMRNLRPANVIIFGASGDLTQRKLVPALHSVACEQLLPKETRVTGVARSPMSDQEFRERLYEGVESYARLHPGICEPWGDFKSQYTYLAGDYDDPDTYRQLARQLADYDAQHDTSGNRLLYLATPPTLYPVIIDALGRAGGCAHFTGNAFGSPVLILIQPVRTPVMRIRFPFLFRVFDSNIFPRLEKMF